MPAYDEDPTPWLIKLPQTDEEVTVDLREKPHVLITSTNPAHVSATVDRFHQHLETYPDVWALEHITADTEPVDAVTHLGRASTTLAARDRDLRNNQTAGVTAAGWSEDSKHGNKHVLVLLEDIQQTLNPTVGNLSEDDREALRTVWFLTLRLIRLGKPVGIHIVAATAASDTFLLGREFTAWIDTTITHP